MDGREELTPHISLPAPDLRPAFSGLQVNPEASRESTLHIVKRVDDVVSLAQQVPSADHVPRDQWEEDGLWVDKRNEGALGISSGVELGETRRIGSGAMRIVVHAYEESVEMTDHTYPEYDFANFPPGFPRHYDYTIRIDASVAAYFDDADKARKIFLDPNTYGTYLLNKDGEIGRLVEIVSPPEVPDPRPLLHKAVPAIAPGNPDIVAGEMYPATFEALGFALNLVEGRVKQSLKK